MCVHLPSIFNLLSLLFPPECRSHLCGIARENNTMLFDLKQTIRAEREYRPHQQLFGKISFWYRCVRGYAEFVERDCWTDASFFSSLPRVDVSLNFSDCLICSFVWLLRPSRAGLVGVRCSSVGTITADRAAFSRGWSVCLVRARRSGAVTAWLDCAPPSALWDTNISVVV